MSYDFRDAEHYASTIRSIIIEEATNADIDEPAMPETLVAYWAENMYDACYKAYNDYILGKRDDYKLNDIESYEQFEKAGLQYTQEMIDSMVDKDLLEVSVGPGGDLLYSATEKGQQTLKQYEINNKPKKRGRPRKK
jgi:hypothetical protein